MNDRFRHRTRVSRTTAVGKTGSARSRIGALGQRSQALLTTLYCSTDCLCRRGAAMKNLAQSASLHAGENNAPSKPGTKHVIGCGQILVSDFLGRLRELRYGGRIAANSDVD